MVFTIIHPRGDDGPVLRAEYATEASAKEALRIALGWDEIHLGVEASDPIVDGRRRNRRAAWRTVDEAENDIYLDGSYLDREPCVVCTFEVKMPLRVDVRCKTLRGCARDRWLGRHVWLPRT